VIFRLVVQTLAFLAVVGAALLSAGGDPVWPEAWIYLAEMATFSLALGIWLAGYDPALLSARLSSPIQKDQRPWDRIFMGTAFVAFFAWIGLMGLDARRFRWSETSLWCEFTGLILIALCMVICWRTFRSNTFASPQVRMQGLRNHKVVTNGPYRFIRHPMYAGALLYFLGVPLLLGSWCGLMLFPVFAFGLGARAIGEERMLRSRLTDYDIYARNVRYRFIPYVW